MTRLIFALLTVFALGVDSIHAQTWLGTADTSYPNAANWSTAVPTSGQTATFNNAGNGNIALNLGGAFPVNTILFDTAACAAYSFSGVVGVDAFIFDAGGGVTRNATVTASQSIDSALQFLGAFTITNNSTTGSLTFNGGASLAGGGTAGLMTVTGAGTTNFNGIIATGAVSGLTKTGAGTLLLGAANTYGGNTTFTAGTLRLGVNNALPVGTTLAMPVSTANSTITFDLQGNSQTLANMTFTNTANATVIFTGTAGSALTVSPATLTIAPSSSLAAFNLAVNMSTLGSFTYNNPTGTINLNNGPSANPAANACTYTFSSTLNNFTAATMNLGTSSSGGGVVNTNINLGTLNNFAVNTIRLGSGRTGAVMAFSAGLTNPVINITGAAGGASTAVLNIGQGKDSNTTSTTPSDTFNTTLGTLNGQFSNISIAQNLPNNASGRVITFNASFLMGAGNISANTMTITSIVNRTTPTPANTITTLATGTFTLSLGGTANIGTMNFGTSTYTDTFNGTNTMTSTFNLNTGGTLNATTIQRGNVATPTGGTVGQTTNFNWNDGTIGNITGTNLTITVPTMVANGAAANHTFNISGANTGSVSSIISGVGVITKSGTGTLTFSGVNTYSGGTIINAGTLMAAGTGTIGAVTAPLTLSGGTFDLNGLDRTVGVFSGTSGSVLNNAPATAATLTFGTAANANFAGSILDNSGTGGTTGITKAGSGTMTLSGTNSYTGTTTINAGTLQFNSAAPTGSGLTLNAGGNLIYANGTGNNLSALPSLSLAAGTGNSQLTMQLATISTSDQIGTTGTAVTGTAANSLILNFTALSGFGVGMYPLFNATGGGLTAGGLNYAFGTLPPGFAYNLIKTDTLITLDVFTVVPSTGPIYWTGNTNAKWNETSVGNAVNFTTDAAGTIIMTGSPNVANTVNFTATTFNSANTSITTLETNFTIGDLIFNAVPTATNAFIEIAAGAVPTSTLSLNPALSTAGINVQTGAPAAITISAPVAIGTFNQTWTVADALTSLTSSGGLSGSANITTAGAGSVFLNNAGTGFTGNIAANGSALSIGGTVASTFNGVISGTAAIIKADTATVVFGATNTYTGSTTINGGRLDVLSIDNGGVNSGIGASSNAAANLAFSGGGILTTAALANTTDRNITMTGDGRIAAITAGAAMVFNGTFTGPGTLIIGINGSTVSSTSTYALNGDSSAGFTGGFTLNNGAVTIKNANALGAGVKTLRLQVNSTGTASLILDGSGGNITLPTDFSIVTSLGGAGCGIFSTAGNNVIAGDIQLDSGNGSTLFSAATGATLTLTGNVTNVLTVGTRFLQFGGLGNSFFSGNLADNTGVAVGFLKNAEAGTTLVTSTGSTYTGNTIVLGGTLKAGVNNAFSTTSRLFFGDQSANIGTFDTNGFDVQFNGLSAQSNNTSGASLLIGSGKTVTVTGATVANVVNIGSIASAVVSTTRLNVSGAGTLTVNDPTRNIVIAQIITVQGTNSPSILDLSALATFNASVNNIYVARPTAAAGTAATTGSAEAAQFIFADNNTITASTDFVVGIVGFSSGATNTGTVRLGTANSINVNRMVFGGSRASGTLNFRTGLTNPTATLRGAAGGTSRITTVILGDQPNSSGAGSGGGGSTGSNGTWDFSLGTVDVMIDTLTVGQGGGVTNSVRGKGNGFITLNGTGSMFDVNTLIMSRNTSDTAATSLTNDTSSTSLITVNNGLFVVNTAATMGNDIDVTGGGIQDLSATVTVNNGTFRVGSTLVPVDLLMGNHTSTNPGTITATVNVNGGSADFHGNVVQGLAGSGVTNATVNINGGSVNLNGFSIGSSSQPVTLNTVTGTMQNVLQINGGTTGITKNTAGTFTLAGTNSYSGPTTVSNGTLLVTADNSFATGAVLVDGGVTGGTLRGTGTLGGAVTVNGGTFPGTIRAGASIGTLTLNNGLTMNAGGRIYVELAGTAIPAAADTGLSTVGALPNPASNNFLNIAAGFTFIDLGTVIVIDGSAATFAPGTSYSYKIGQGAGVQSFSITAASQFNVTGVDIDPSSLSFTGNAGGDLFVNFTTAIPEPGLALLLLLPLARRLRK